MAKKSPDKVLRDSQLGIATAEKVFGGKNVDKHDGELIGKKQDKLGRWRKAKVPIYSSDPDERMSSSGLRAILQETFQGYDREEPSQRVGHVGATRCWK
ncbi:MAG TPA: hypothetical protein VGJ66_04680 [Pyrinomonadaceae bacterium]|jgi:hypothetical protein